MNIKTGEGMERQMDSWTDRPTDGWTDVLTDRKRAKNTEKHNFRASFTANTFV